MTKPAKKQDWEFSHTEEQYQIGIAGTSSALIEYAYWINKKTLEVKKVEVKHEK
jgi:hypothetical protein